MYPAALQLDTPPIGTNNESIGTHLGTDASRSMPIHAPRPGRQGVCCAARNHFPSCDRPRTVLGTSAEPSRTSERPERPCSRALDELRPEKCSQPDRFPVPPIERMPTNLPASRSSLASSQVAIARTRVMQQRPALPNRDLVFRSRSCSQLARFKHRTGDHPAPHTSRDELANRPHAPTYQLNIVTKPGTTVQLDQTFAPTEAYSITAP